MDNVFSKLNLKDQKSLLVLQAPSSFEPVLASLHGHVAVHRKLEESPQIEFVMAFVTQQREIDQFVPLISAKLSGDAVIWFCYPKGSSKKYKCDFNRDTGWSAMGQHGLEPVRQVAIDEDWSALRFRRVEYIKTMTRGFAMTEQGKEKVARSKGKP